MSIRIQFQDSSLPLNFPTKEEEMAFFACVDTICDLSKRKSSPSKAPAINMYKLDKDALKTLTRKINHKNSFIANLGEHNLGHLSFPRVQGRIERVK